MRINIFKLFRKKEKFSQALWQAYLECLYSKPTQLDRIEIKLKEIENKLDKLPQITEKETK